MIPKALLEKFIRLNFITGSEVSYMTRHSSKLNKLRNENRVRGKTGNVTFHKRKNFCVKIKVIVLIINFG